MASGVLALATVLGTVDVLAESGRVPRGTAVDGVAVGGLSAAEAEARLRTWVQARSEQPVAVAVGSSGSSATAVLDPRTTGLAVDWPATMAEVTATPLNPLTRVRTLLSPTARRLTPVVTVDRLALQRSLEQLRPVLDLAPVEGAVRFAGTVPVGIEPRPGRRLDVPAAAATLIAAWPQRTPILLPTTSVAPVTDLAAVTSAVDGPARLVTDGPVTVLDGHGARGVLGPDVLAAALRFRPQPTGLVADLDPTVVAAALSPQLAATRRPVDPAAPPPVEPDPVTAAADLLAVASGPGGGELILGRPRPAGPDPWAVTSPPIGTFTVTGFAPDSAVNIARAAALIDGEVVGPGEVFSMDAATGPRDATNGYVEAGVITDGGLARGMAGGASSVATALYNAAYFAGLEIVEQRPHSLHLDRYPAGREATVVEGSLDLRFRNDGSTPVVVRARASADALVVALHGERRFAVTSRSGPRTDPTPPAVRTVPPGQPCTADAGSPGFTTTDTRTLRDVATGAVRVEERRWTYRPTPATACPR